MLALKDLFSNTSVNDIIAFIKDTHFYNRIYCPFLLSIVIIQFRRLQTQQLAV